MYVIDARTVHKCKRPRSKVLDIFDPRHIAIVDNTFIGLVMETDECRTTGMRVVRIVHNLFCLG